MINGIRRNAAPKSRTNFYLRAFELFLLSTLPPSCFLFKVSQPNKAFRGHPGPWAEFLRYMDFLPGSAPPYISQLGICHPKGYGFCTFLF